MGMSDPLYNSSWDGSQIYVNGETESSTVFSGLCNDPFWDYNRSWNSHDPEFSSCFRRTAVVWLPCGFFLLQCPIYFYVLKKRPYNPIPWTALSYTKLALSFVTVAATIAELSWVAIIGQKVYSLAELLAPILLLITYVLHIALVCLGRLHGERTSWTLWVFWFIMILCGIPQVISSIGYLMYPSNVSPPVLDILYILQYIVTIALFITNWFADAPSKLQLLMMTKKPNPELSASFPSRMMLWWCFPLIWTGWKRPIVFDDLWDVKPDFSATLISKHWHEDFITNPKYSKESFDTGKASKGKKVYLYRRIWRMCRSSIFFLCFVYALAEMLRFVPPQLLSLLINFITNTDEPSWHGFLYAVSLLLACEFTSVIKNHYFYHAVNLSIKIRSALMSAIYQKALKLSGSARRISTLGQIVNMMAVDAQIVGETTWQILSIVFAPVIILVSMAFLWEKLGPSVLSGLAVLVLLTPVNSYLANKTKQCQLEAIKLRDKRVKMSSEIVGGIKVLKLYAWEESFAKQIQAVRDEEVSYFRKIALLQAFSGFIFNVSPYMVSLATFTTYLMVSSDNVLDAEMAFVSIALFNIMKIPITQMPSVVAQIIQASVALKRLKEFFAGDELDPLAVCSDRSEKADLLINNGQFSWEGADGLPSWTFKDVNLRIIHGKLVAVVGPVGAGKSSLISALLGEIKKDSGKVVVNGSMAYVSQQAWLQNATLRDNITWGLPFDEKWYKKVIHACALQPDLDMLDGGDMTEVGEKGINLSGGQKQRISLARAVYRDADIILLDDPLSAVDAHVGKHIFEHVIGPSGLLKSKTRLLVTHAVTYLPQVDEVVVVKDGHLVENGTYNDLVAADGDFAQFVFQYVTSCDDEAVDEEILELRDNLEGATRGEVLRQLSQMSSTESHSTVPNQLGKYSSLKHLEKQDGGRKRSMSESQEDTMPGHHFVSNKQLNHSIRSMSLMHNDKVLHKQISNISAGGIHGSRNGSIYDSNISIHSSIGKEELMSMEMSPLEELEEKDKTHMIVNEELQETGKVARYVYLVYGRAMGALYAITPIVSLSLGQGCVAGGNVWLSFWSSSGSSDVNAIFVNSTLEPLPAEDSGQVSREAFLTGYGAFGVGQAVFIYCGQVFILLGCLRAANFLHSSLLHSVIRLPMSFFDTNPSGRVINRFSKEMSSLDFNLPNIMRSLLSCSTQVVATLIVIIISTPIAAVALIPIMIIYYLMQVVYVSTSRQIKRIESVSKSPIYTHFSESLQGVSVIRAFKKQHEFIEESLSKIDRFIKAVSFNVSANRWVAIHLETLGNTITFAAAMLAVLGRETISPGIVGLSVTYALNITLVLNWLVRIASDLEAHIVSVERINEYIQKEQEAAWVIEDRQPNTAWPDNGSISFNHYETRYRPGLDLVLKGITCTFRPSEKVGIVGRTGAGKSSLTLALFRLIESAGGNINIDGTNIADIGLHELRSRLSIIPQDPVLFSGTLRMNLDPFEKHSDDSLWHSLELAHLKEYIMSQPLGLLHPVDEEGSNFSVGQRQLLCLARALLRHSKILVLDEATAAVDLETDDLIQATIRDQFKECTVLTIAHRINTIMDCDRVLVLSQGQIAEFDTPAALLADSHSIFHGMAVDAGLI